MEITNKLGFPDAIYQAAKKDEYTKGNAKYSITDLIKPIQEVYLKRKHSNELVQDVSDMMWMILGSAVHHIIEKGTEVSDNVLVEKRMSMLIGDVLISGCPDIIYILENRIEDYKVTSAYKVMKKDVMDWTIQLNCYRQLAKNQMNLEINDLQITAIIRDWKKSEAQRNPLYPQSQVEKITIPVWDYIQTLLFITNRVLQLEYAMNQDNIPACTSLDKWEKPSTYACIKAGNTKATKVFTDIVEAKAFADEKQLSVVTRPGGCLKCEEYCIVKDFCSQYKNENSIASSSNDYIPTSDDEILKFIQ